MNDFFLFLFFIDGILGLILFVKVWSMTSDVRNIRDRICRSQGTFKKRFTEYYLCGEYEEAYKFLNHTLANDLDSRFRNMSRNSKDIHKDFNDWASKHIEIYSSYYKLIGRDVPEIFKSATYEFFDKNAW